MLLCFKLFRFFLYLALKSKRKKCQKKKCKTAFFSGLAFSCVMVYNEKIKFQEREPLKLLKELHLRQFCP